MEDQVDRVVSSSTPAGAAEERMLRADLVREMVARAHRGEGAKRIARELGVDRKTVKRWLRLGAWQPRRHQPRPRPVDDRRDCRRSRLVNLCENACALCLSRSGRATLLAGNRAFDGGTRRAATRRLKADLWSA